MTEAGARLLEELMRFRPEGLTANAWAVNAGVSRTIWADLRRHGNPSRRTLEKLLAAVGSSLAEFEALRVEDSAEAFLSGQARLGEGSQGWRAARPAPVPLLETAAAGEWGDRGRGIERHSIDRSRIVARLDRPAALAADAEAYAVTMTGDTMWPRFRDGRRLLVSPAVPVSVGDDVLVQLAGGKALIKEMVGRSADMIELRQFNPDVAFEVQTAEIAALHKVVGEAI